MWKWNMYGNGTPFGMMTSSNWTIFRATSPLWIHRSPVDSTRKGQWRRTLMFSLIWAWTNGWANNRDASHLRRHHAHYDVTVMTSPKHISIQWHRVRFMASQISGNSIVSSTICAGKHQRNLDLNCIPYYRPFFRGFHYQSGFPSQMANNSESV